MEISVRLASLEDVPNISEMVGELLGEIMNAIDQPVFNFDLAETTSRLSHFLECGKYQVILAEVSGELAGFLSLYEGYALYAEGALGTIAECYVRPAFRSAGAGACLVAEARKLGVASGWTRLEVTTPPLPQFERTLAFYERQGFSISGGRKLKIAL